MEFTRFFMYTDLRRCSLSRRITFGPIWQTDGAVDFALYGAAPRGAKFMSLFMQLLIFISSVIFIIETLEKVRADQELLETFHVVEWMCIFAFTIEYLMRVATCTRRP